MLDDDARWPMFRHVWRQADLLDHVLARLGVTPADAARLDAGMAYAGARDTCLDCPRAQACARWLAQPDPVPALPAMCANAAFFARCRALAPMSRLA